MATGENYAIITAELEDLAGNVSNSSTPLKVTIANQALSLPGGTASGPAVSPVQVDLAAGTVDGYPGIAGVSGLVGIVGIPTVMLNANGMDLTVLGTAIADDLHYQPTGAQAGDLTRAGSPQRISFTNVGGTFMIDPLGGVDTVNVGGTALADVITVLANAIATVQVSALKTANLPIANVERLALHAGQSQDVIDITAFDNVMAQVFVDTGEPTSNPPNGDILTVRDGSGRARLRNMSGGAVPNSGSVLVEYRRTTGNTTRVDYVGVERFTRR